MTAIVNKPLANTFGWLRVNGAEIDLPDEIQAPVYDLGENEEHTVVLDGDSLSAKITARLEKNAVLRLVQLRRGGEGASVCDIKVSCGENARFEWYRVVLGGEKTYDNCSVLLDGEGSSFAAEIGYRLGGDESLDINCEAIHTGPGTDSRIHASGVLSGRAFKLLRGTIDFRTGCAGATGNEMEDVLLMDDTVRNQSVPVILCSEEDVTGDHGATIGRPDEQTVFYLESRGIEKKAVYEMMAKAKLDAVLHRLPPFDKRGELVPQEVEA